MMPSGIPFTAIFPFFLLLAGSTAGCSVGPTSSGVPTNGFVEHSRTSNMLDVSLCDFGTPPLTNQHLDFVAGHFGSIVVGTEADVAGIHAANPNVVMYAYFNVMFTAVSEQDRYSEDMFMHDPTTGARLSVDLPNSGPNYFMDPGSTAWRQFAADHVTGEVARGFDGALLDDVWGDWAHPFRPHPDGLNEIPAWYDPVAFRSAVRGMLEFVDTAMGTAPVLFNGYGPVSLNPSVPYEEVEYIPVTDGVVLEGFVYDDRFGGSYIAEAEWPLILDALLGIEEGKTIGVICYGPQDHAQARLFSLASYLLGVRAMSTFSYTPECNVLTFLPEFDIQLGGPTETFSTINESLDADSGVYTRRFGNGMVMVNPTSATTQSIALPHSMFRVSVSGGNVPELGGAGSLTTIPVDTVVLGPFEGVVLLNSTGTIPAMSAWGLVLMSGMMLTTGTVIYRHRTGNRYED